MAEAPLMTFVVEAQEEGEGFHLSVAPSDGSGVRSYRVEGPEPDAFEALYDELHRDFGTRRPHQTDPIEDYPAPPWKPLITGNLSPRILSGYGDPAVMKADDGWWLVATSNDAPDAFPILHSPDLEIWEPKGFVFEEGQTPGWTAAGQKVGDFWAPEIACVGGEYWLSYTARAADRTLSIGLARSAHPGGPWTDNGAPLLTGTVIDSHVHVDADGTPWLLWKKDSNSHWPRPLAGLLRENPQLIPVLFDSEQDRRTAAFCAAVQPFANTRRPMERFFLMQPLIRAALANWRKVKTALEESGVAGHVVENMATPIYAQQLSADGRGLVGERHLVLANDLDWEGHLIEGPYLTRQEGRYFLFYAGNDFTSPSYGIGYAVADRITGPYRKCAEPLLRSHPDWSAPGHASVSVGTGGEPRLFFHAYHPGTGGYNVFRALMTIGLAFSGDEVRLVP
ncbi:glycoside hydrolase family 43 protein [Sphingomonas sp. LHG3406-1]|uniref:glycoside hydrolase family 43 protein n=1 Tax=Sphingomonas sp. LHG3406-1 TaxID=2804617 RepID=UPI00261E6A54|nr:glycoside hydrolase family 43 protein [Sphingomonas sp. LHG3406-1]